MSMLSHLVGRLRYRQLALLVALGEHCNLHRAAEAVHMAQPSATKVVRELGRLFGFPLFERLPRGMHPTPLGADIAKVQPHRRRDAPWVGWPPAERSPSDA